MGLWFDKYKITKPVRLIELFAGIGAQAKALENLGVNFEHWKICEFDKYPVCSYNAIHHTNFLPSDITKIHAEDLEIKDTDKYEYIMTYSFPCTDLSLAGKRLGMSRESGTRSGLLWEVERLLKECNEKSNLPQILLMENVPQVIGKGNKEDFDEWYNFLASLGYSSKYKILNSKNFGIPQNRQRCYMVSILGDYEYEFPSGFPLKLTLRDLLEKNVDEKYYLSEKMIESFTYNSQKQKEKGNGFKFEPTNGEGVGKTITTLAGNRMDDNFIFGNENLNETLEKNKDKLGNDVLSIDAYNKSVHKDISQTITTRVNDSNQHFLYEGVCINDNENPESDMHTQLKVVEKSIPIKENTKKGYKEAHVGDGVYINRVDVKRGTVQKDMIQTITTSPNDIGVVVEDELIKVGELAGGKWDKINESCRRVYDSDGIAPTVTTCGGGNQEIKICQKVSDTGISPSLTSAMGMGGGRVPMHNYNLRIRKLTPKECWRLMGFDDIDFDNAKKALNDTFYNGEDRSNSQLYKQAGNSIVVNVLMAIFKQLF